MTRARFSRKVGIPAASLKAIETGKYKLKPEVAAQIAAVTKVDPKCLMDPGLPLTDHLGDPFIKGEMPLAAYMGDEYKDIKALFDAAIDAAEEKQKQVFFSFLFLQWFEETCEILGLRSAMTEKLLWGYPWECFASIPQYLWPKDRKRRQELDEAVKKFEAEFFVRFSVEFEKVVKDRAPGMLPGLLVNETALRNQFEHAKSEAARKNILLRRLRSILIPFADALEQQDLSFGKVQWDIRRKMIEEAKAAKPV
jgi:DNA-binding XRE family transcriptional regulator